MNKKSAHNEPVSRNKAKTRWNTESDGQGKSRSFITVNEFWERMDLIGFRDFQGAAADMAHSNIKSLFKDRIRIYSAGTGKASNFRAADTSVRALMRAFTDPTEKFLEQARVGFDELEAAFMYHDGFWRHPRERYAFPLKYQSSTLSEALRASNDIDAQYLDWVINLRKQKNPKFQRKLASFVYLEHQLEERLNDLDERLFAQDGDQVELSEGMQEARISLLDLKRKNKSECEFTSKLRNSFEKNSWPWQTSHVGIIQHAELSAAWPFVLELVGDESSDELLLASINYEAIGLWMERVGSELSLDLSEKAESDAEYKLRHDAFHAQYAGALAKIHTAGTFLRMQARMLEVFATPANEATRRCELCFRRVGKRKQKYCDLHSINIANADPNEVSQRTRLRQSQTLADGYVEKSDQLFGELSNTPFFLDPTGFLSRELASVRASCGDVRKDPECSIKELEVFLRLLRSVVGTSLFAEFEVLAKSLSIAAVKAKKSHTDVLDNLKASRVRLDEVQDKLRRELQEKTLEKTSRRGLLTELAEEETHISDDTKLLMDAVNELKKIACLTRIESEKCNKNLTVKAFLVKFFNHIPAGALLPTDANHPLIKKTDDKLFTLPAAPAFNLNQIVREDLLALRAWIEVGGESIDKALSQSGKPLPVSRQVRKLPWDFLLECIDKLGKAKPSPQEIADAIYERSNGHIRVTRSAVSQAITRRKTTLDAINPHA